FDPEGDYFRITRELPGRRINLTLPEESLLVQKAIGAVPHTGGKRFEPGDPLYQRIVSWLEAGAPRDERTPPAVKRLEIYPPAAVLEGPGSEQQMVVRAVYDDGSDRDVTGLSLFLSNNDNAADINAAGRVTTGQRGEAFVMAR